ncbi:MAG: hypothetical protein OXI30_04675 [Chloroflexota bacterium]|nr:hypothetical protein [Chloroflexota bacterium]
MLELPDTNPINDPEYLWTLQGQLLAMVKVSCGARDQSFEIFRPQFCKNGPNIRIEYSPIRGAYAQLGYNGRFCWPIVVYQLAQETVHFLNPVKWDEVSFLEEGVSIALAIHAQKQFKGCKKEPNPDNEADRKYVSAYSLVKQLPDGALESARRIRQKVGRLSAATADDLMSLYHGRLEPTVAEKLASKFNA